MGIQFGWRVPDFPVDGSGYQAFRDQQFAFLDQLQGYMNSVWVADHFVPWLGTQDQGTDTFECWTTLVYLAARYPGMRLGSIVMSQSYRRPALLAKMATTLQALSGGRFILGIGAGWKQDEYLAYGYDFPSAATRIHQLDEAAHIIRLMWTQPRASFEGRHYQIKDAICEPKPSPLPPLLIGGGGKQLTLRVVARHADWWNIVNSTPQRYQELLDVLRGHCQAAGRDYDTIVKTYSCESLAIAGTAEAAQRIADASPFYSPESAWVGTPDQVAERVQAFVDLGVQHVILRFLDFPSADGALLFAREVQPRFQR